MTELLIPRIEEEDIKAPQLRAGGTTCVLQRHGPYQQDRTAENAGSLTDTSVYKRDAAFFDDLLNQETSAGPKTMFLFAASDTNYAGKGYRSMETTALALQAAREALQARGLDPNERIINLNPAFHTDRFPNADEPVRALPRLREPQLWEPETAGYVAHLLQKYGDSESGDLSTEAWQAHESDSERDDRMLAGAEGIYEIIERTKQTLDLLGRYANIFHASNPNTHIVLWAGTHYDTISPLVKDATGTPLEQYIPVANGAGVVIDFPPGGEAYLQAQDKRVKLRLGKRAVGS